MSLLHFLPSTPRYWEVRFKGQILKMTWALHMDYAWEGHRPIVIRDEGTEVLRRKVTWPRPL